MFVEFMELCTHFQALISELILEVKGLLNLIKHWRFLLCYVIFFLGNERVCLWNS
jgi:hypothetical protein